MKAGESKQLVSLPFNAYSGESAYPVFAAQVEQEVSHSFVLPRQLSVIAGYAAADAVNRNSPRIFTLAMGRGMNWTLNGRTFDMTSVAKDEIVRLG